MYPIMWIYIITYYRNANDIIWSRALIIDIKLRVEVFIYQYIYFVIDVQYSNTLIYYQLFKYSTTSTMLNHFHIYTLTQGIKLSIHTLSENGSICINPASQTEDNLENDSTVLHVCERSRWLYFYTPVVHRLLHLHRFIA